MFINILLSHIIGDRAPTQLYYIPVVVAVLIALVSPLLMNAAFQPWLYKALVLLVIACQCALVISTPVTVISGQLNPY